MRDSFFGSSIHSVITNFLLGFTEFFKTTSWILFFFSNLLVLRNKKSETLPFTGKPHGNVTSPSGKKIEKEENRKKLGNSFFLYGGEPQILAQHRDPNSPTWKFE